MGCGYVGRQVAAREVMDGGSVEAIVRTDESASRLNATGIHASVGDLEAGIPRHLKLGHKVVYWFAPPQPDGVQDRRIRNFLGSMDDRHGLPHRVVLISTTGVYGDCQGDWVTEDRERPAANGAGSSASRCRRCRTQLVWREQHYTCRAAGAGHLRGGKASA